VPPPEVCEVLGDAERETINQILTYPLRDRDLVRVLRRLLHVKDANRVLCPG